MLKRDYDATNAQEPPEGVSVAAPVPSIPPAEIAVDAGKKIMPEIAEKTLLRRLASRSIISVAILTLYRARNPSAHAFSVVPFSL